jgi:hypothetical protein
MAHPESLEPVRTRIGLQNAEIETRSTKLKPVDMGARMAAIRSMAAEHGLVAPDSVAGHSVRLH